MAERPRPRRSADHRHRLRLRRLLVLLPLALLLALLSQLPALLRRANSLGRRCLPGAPDRLVRDPRLSLAIVTLADDGVSGSRGRRSFRGVLAATARNKRAYAAAQGYHLVALPASAVDSSRPPSWSKVLALRVHLRCHHWLFWNDAVGRRCYLITVGLDLEHTFSIIRGKFLHLIDVLSWLLQDTLVTNPEILLVSL
jgi:mannan polymerase II complex MNN10 subunit